MFKVCEFVCGGPVPFVTTEWTINETKTRTVRKLERQYLREVVFGKQTNNNNKAICAYETWKEKGGGEGEGRGLKAPRETEAGWWCGDEKKLMEIETGSGKTRRHLPRFRQEVWKQEDH